MSRWSMIPAGLMAIWVAANPAASDDGTAIRGVIGNQIEAFGSEDLDTAYGFASPMIQRMFPTPEIFGRMVREGYPMIWRPDSVSYLGLREEGGRIVQRMGFKGTDGDLHLFDYDMVTGPEGWRINGVYPVELDGTGV